LFFNFKLIFLDTTGIGIDNNMGYIDSDYAIKLKSMAGFRNILIHLYYEVDDRKVIKHLKKDLWIIEDFLGVVERLIKRQG